MKRFLQTGKNSSIGLDIGRSSIKAVQLQKRRDSKIALLAYARVNINNNRRVDSILHPSQYLPALQNLLQSPNYGEFSGRNLAIALPDRHTYIQHNVSADEFVQQAIKSLNTTVDDLIINTYRHSQSLSVSIASAQTIIAAHLNALSELGTVTNSDHELSAAIRTLGITAQSAIIVDIGSNETIVGVVNALVISTQRLTLGVDSFAALLAEKLNMPVNETSELLFSLGFLPGALQVKIREASKLVLAPLFSALQNIIPAYNTEQLILCGGGAVIPGIEEYMQSILDIPVTIADPWKRIGKYPLKPIPKKIAPLFATAVGLALLDLE